jgi:hypothetical protein
MTDYRDRKVKGLLIPADERVEIGEPETRSIREWLKLANIQYMGFVNASSKISLQLVIDEDGLSRNLPWNPRAHYLTSYPVDHPIVGDGFMVSLAMVGMGMDMVDLTPEAHASLKDPTHRERFTTWLSQETAQGYFNQYRRRFPQPN